MTDPREGSNGDWDDNRLDGAFRARFDAQPPSGLVERITTELETQPQIGWLESLRRSSLGLAAAALAVVAVLVATQSGLVHPGPAAGSPGVSTTPTASRPTEAVGPPFPASIVIQSANQHVAVISVAEAVAIRDGGVDRTEMAVAGWYVPWEPIPCPAQQDEYQPLEGCYLSTAWLLGKSELAPVGSEPAIHPVTDWRPADPHGSFPVVFVGHFDDAGAASCPAGERYQVCSDRFVVDEVAWDEQALSPGFPSEAAGLPVISVEQAIGDRVDLATELAVAGWYQSPQGVLSCPYVPGGVPPLLNGCVSSYTWLMAAPEALIHVSRSSANGGSVSTTGGPPVGPAFNLTFDAVSGPQGVPLPADGDSTPTKVVFVGHFNDRRALFCGPDAESFAACQRVFVVDAVAWVSGSEQSVPANVDLRDSGSPTETRAQLDRVQSFLRSRSWVLHTVLVPGSRASDLEPAISDTYRPQPAHPLWGEPLLWLAAVVETIPSTSEPIVRTYVIDSTGNLYLAAGSEIMAIPG